MPALTAEQLLTGIRSDLKTNLGGFRQAANDNNSQISKIVRDISRTFATQRADIASLEDSIEENTQETRQTAARIDGMISILQESISIQMGMLSELKNMSYYIRLLAQGAGGSLLGSGLGGGLGGFAERVVNVGKGGLASFLTTAAGVGTAEMLSGGGGGAGGDVGSGKVESKWWTPERQKYAVDTLQKQAGLSEIGAAGLVARWAGIESPGGPASKNPDSGAFGIAQWLGDRQKGILGNTNFDDQLAYVVKELNTTEKAAAEVLRNAKTAGEAARGASMYERAEGYNSQTGVDYFTSKTPVIDVYNRVTQNSQTTVPQTSNQQTPASATAPAADAQPVSDSNQNSESQKISARASEDPTPTKKDAERVDNKSAEKLVTGESLEGVNPALASAFLAAVKDYGKPVRVNSAVRSKKEQEVLWNKKQRGEIKYPVAFPGTSLHEKGLAIDINEAIAEDMDRKGILAKHGLNRPVPGDPVHIQLMGTSKHKGEGPTMQEAGIRQETPQSPPPAAPQATPVSGGEVSSPTYSQSSMGADINMMASMLSGFLPGGLGGIVSGIAPMLTEALSSIEAPNMLNQAAVQTQSNQEIAQERASMEPETPSASTGNPPQAIGYNNMGMPQHEFKNLEESDWPERFMFGLNQLLYGIGGIRFLS